MTHEQAREQAKALVEKMTIEEAASQLLHNAPPIARLGVPGYNWWSEGLHGVARAGIATVFPQAIGLAAMFDEEKVQETAEAIAEEGRAKYNAAQACGDTDIYKGLTYWSPNINIFRDPKWGRGHETYGEDPYLTSRLGVAFIKGLQGDGEYLKLAACAKHFAVHSGPEKLRHSFNAETSPKDMEETYLPAFEAAVREGNVEAVMGAYNAVNGTPSCANEYLLEKKLRGEWGFEGHVVSDCWAIADFYKNHHYTNSPEESASIAVRRGCDLNCGCTYEHLLEGLEKGLISEEEIRTACTRLMTTRYLLGMFDDCCAYNEIPYQAVASGAHKKLACETAEKSLVLLKNDGVLPLDRSKVKSIAVIGPNAYSSAALYGNYNGYSAEWITNLDGIRREAGENITVYYSEGCHISKAVDDALCREGRLFGEAETIARLSDVVVLCLGLDASVEGEEGDTGNVYFSGDKENLLLPEIQRKLYERIIALGKKVILVLNSGSNLDVSAYEEKTSAIIQAWYSGERGGEALANVLFGKTSPSGKLPLTFYYENQPMPEFTDYSMCGRTYKFVKSRVQYPFGYGLSYTKFAYSEPELHVSEDGLAGSVTIENTGETDADEVVQGYLHYCGEAFEKPAYTLVWYKRVSVRKGEKVKIDIAIDRKQMLSVLENGDRQLLDGEYVLFIGGNAPDTRSYQLTGVCPHMVHLTVKEGMVSVGEALAAGIDDLIGYEDETDYTNEELARRKYTADSLMADLLENPQIKAILTAKLDLVRDCRHLGTLVSFGQSLRDFIRSFGREELMNVIDEIDGELKQIV